MKFDDLDARMRSFEGARDPCASAESILVARIDGRSFTRLTKDVMDFARPFDERFRDHMIETVEHLMSSGFHVIFGYTQSDEISLLFGQDERSFGRNIRKFTSILAGEASAAFTLRIGRTAAFDCRVIELPSSELVVDYFRWRSEDANRNALNAWCYWTLRDEGLSVRDATKRLEGMPISDKVDLLSQRRVSFDDLPGWQRRGAGVHWEEYDKPATNPKTGEVVSVRRRRLTRSLDLPIRNGLDRFLLALLAQDADSAKALSVDTP